VKHLVAAAIALVLAGLAAGCSGGHEANLEEQIQLWRTLNETLKDVTDEVSLDSVVPALEKLDREMKEALRRREALGPLPEEKRRALLATYGEALRAESRVFGAHMQRFEELPGDRTAFREKLTKAIGHFQPED